MKADLLHVTSAFVLVLVSWQTAASQLFIYGITTVHGFIAVSCNLMVTFGDAHWVELIRPQRWAGVRACPDLR